MTTMDQKKPTPNFQNYEDNITWDDITKSYKELLGVDLMYSGLVSRLAYAFVQYRTAELEKPDSIRRILSDPENLMISGSCSDGGGTCRWFRHGTIDLELDVMVQIGEIKEDNQDEILVFSLEKPGFAQIKRGFATFDVLHPYLKTRGRYEKFAPVLALGEPGQEYIDTVLAKETFGKRVAFKDSDDLFKEILSSLVNVDKSLIDMSLHESIEGPSFLTEIAFSLGEEQNFLFSTDKVIAFKLQKWPELLQQWCDRPHRHWPKQDTVEACIKQGCHLVPKKSSTESDINTEWRFSFSAIEGLLMKSWNEPQRLTYYFLKSLFYRHLRGIEADDVHIPSYVLKCEMFWVIEESCPSEWTNVNLKQNALKVLKRLDHGLKSRFIPNYFIPSMNLIDPLIYKDDLIAEVLSKLLEIEENLEGAVPKDLKKITELGRKIFSMLEIFLQLFELMTVQVNILMQHEHKEEEIKPEPLD